MDKYGGRAENEFKPEKQTDTVCVHAESVLLE